MNDDFWSALFFLVLGGFLLIHCLAATRREYRDGVAVGRYGGKYHRNRQPVGFWLILAVNVFMALVGLAFLIAGAILLTT